MSLHDPSTEAWMERMDARDENERRACDRTVTVTAVVTDLLFEAWRPRDTTDERRYHLTVDPLQFDEDARLPAVYASAAIEDSTELRLFLAAEDRAYEYNDAGHGDHTLAVHVDGECVYDDDAVGARDVLARLAADA